MAFQKNHALDGWRNPKVQGDNNKVNYCSRRPVKFQVFIAILSLCLTKTTFSLRRIEKTEKARIIRTSLKHVSYTFFIGLQTHIVTCCIHLRIHHTSRVPYLIHSFSDCCLCSDDSDFSDKSQAMCQFFDKRGYTVSAVQAGHHRG